MMSEGLPFIGHQHGRQSISSSLRARHNTLKDHHEVANG